MHHGDKLHVYSSKQQQTELVKLSEGGAWCFGNTMPPPSGSACTMGHAYVQQAPRHTCEAPFTCRLPTRHVSPALTLQRNQCVQKVLHSGSWFPQSPQHATAHELLGTHGIWDPWTQHCS